MKSEMMAISKAVSIVSKIQTQFRLEKLIEPHGEKEWLNYFSIEPFIASGL